MSEKKQLSSKKIYHIRFQGSIDERWASWFEGYVLTTRHGGETLLTGSIIDQADLFGVLEKINNLGLPILMVIRSQCPCPEKKCIRHAHCQACASRYENNSKMPFCLRQNTKWDRLCNWLLVD